MKDTELFKAAALQISEGNNAGERQIKPGYQMGNRKMRELARLRKKMDLCAFSPSTTSHSSRLTPLRAASSVPRAELRARSPAVPNQLHGAAEPSVVLLISETRNIWQQPFSSTRFRQRLL